MENKGMLIDTERGRIRLSKQTDDALGNPDYISFVAGDFILSVFPEDMPGTEQRKIKRDRSVELYDRKTVSWICNTYGLEQGDKYVFEAEYLYDGNSFPFVNVHTGKRLTQKAR